MSYTLDVIDTKILALIQKNADLPVAEIADKVGLSASPCWRRIKRMEEAGVITDRVTVINPQILGLQFEALASVKLQLPTAEHLDRFEEAVAEWPEVLDCMTVSGAVDYVLHIITTDIQAYDEFLRAKILSLALVSDVQTRIVIRRTKETRALPLKLVAPKF